MTAVAFGPTSCSSGLVPKSKLLHSPADQYGFVPKHSLHGGKNLALRAEKPFFSEALFLLLDVCNNDSYVIRGVAWA